MLKIPEKVSESNHQANTSAEQESSEEDMPETSSQRDQPNRISRKISNLNDCSGNDENQTPEELSIEIQNMVHMAEMNRIEVVKFLEVVPDRLKKDHWEAIGELVCKYTIDAIEGCEQTLYEFPDCLRVMIIQSLIYTCQTYSSCQAKLKWVKREKQPMRGNEFLFAESDEDAVSLSPFYVEKCSNGHTKCKWLELFLSALPEDLRFEEKWDSDVNPVLPDGPFREEVFLYCMKYGADCQKMKFLIKGTPLGISRTNQYFEMSYVPLACCQGTNLRRIQMFMAVGFDIHRFAVKDGNIVGLNTYIKRFWKICIEEKEENGDEIDPVMMKYFKQLPKMLRQISYKMKRFMAREHERKITNVGGNLMKRIMSITYPHILRCHPTQNENNGGEGIHLVPTCLFYQQGCVRETGLRPESERVQVENECEEDLKRFRTIIRNRDGKFVLFVYRVDIVVPSEDDRNDEITLPQFNFVRSDENMEIERARIIQATSTSAIDVMNMVEKADFREPGQRVYAFDSIETETQILRPGGAFIELKGKFGAPINFFVELVFVKKNF